MRTYVLCTLCFLTVSLLASGQVSAPASVQVGSSCDCAFTTLYTDSGNTPPDCVASWGVTYTSEDGICDKEGCPTAKQCVADVTMSITLAAGESCSTQIVIYDSEEDETTAGGFASGFEVPYTFNISCGEHFDIGWGADGVPLGSTKLDCADCTSTSKVRDQQPVRVGD